jgi:hypothetical protein
MKYLTAYLLIALTSLVLTGSTLAIAPEKPAGDTKVYHPEGKKRVHVEGCSRLPKDRSGFKIMTLAEAEAKGLSLCSRCPGSPKPGAGDPTTQPTKDDAAD